MVGPLLRHHERTILRLLEAVEERCAGSRDADALRRLYRLWVSDEHFEDLIASLYTTVLDLVALTSIQEATPYVDHALAFLLDDENIVPIEIPASPWPATRTFALEQAAEAVRLAQLGFAVRGLTTPGLYAQRLGLVQRVGDEMALSVSGEILLKLPAIETSHWLLALELSRHDSTTISRIDTPLIKRLLDRGIHTSERDLLFSQHRDRRLLLAEQQTLRRLLALGIVEVEREEEPGVEYFTATARGRSILEDLDSEPPSPLRLLASAATTDQTNGIPGELFAAARQSHEPSAVAGTVLQIRMVAHELRNALVPVKIAFDYMWRALPGSDPPTELLNYRDTILSGLAHVFRFVDDSLRVAQMAPSPPEPFDLVPALRDVISALSADLEREVGFTCDPNDFYPTLRGHRDRFVLAVANILRNARQVVGPAVRIKVGVRHESFAGQALITVDDDGPGVVPEHRPLLFKPGISLRPDGYGHGLSLTREVIEDEMRGTIEYTPGPLGGARFILCLPLTIQGTK